MFLLNPPPPGRNLYPPPFIHPIPRQAFSGLRGWSCIKLGPVALEEAFELEQKKDLALRPLNLADLGADMVGLGVVLPTLLLTPSRDLSCTT